MERFFCSQIMTPYEHQADIIHHVQVLLLREQVGSLERKCKSLEQRIEGDSAEHRAGAETLTATLQRNLELESERKDLTGRTRHAEGAHSSLGQRNEVLEQKVSPCAFTDVPGTRHR